MYAEVEVPDLAGAEKPFLMNGALLAEEKANAAPPVKSESRAIAETFIL
jgi:hypothetical protein